MSRSRPSRDSDRPYPESWEQVADLRVFRTDAEDWDRLATWRADMRKRGWKLLKVTSDEVELIAVFGKTRGDVNPAGV
jgi:hypothetical protein